MKRRDHPRSLARTFAWPTALAAITLAALAAGFAGEGLVDIVAVIGLVLPLAIGLCLAWQGLMLSARTQPLRRRSIRVGPRA